MKHFICSLLALVVMVVAVPAQSYKSRLPYVTEERKIAGVDWYLKDGPRYQILQKYVGEAENITLNDTNSLVLLRSDGALTNAVVVFPNPTNNPGRLIEVVAFANVALTQIGRAHV